MEEENLTPAEETAEEAVPTRKERAKKAVVQYLKTLPKRYFITAFSGMAQGLFCTLIAGTILAQIGGWIGENAFGSLVTAIANIAKSLMGVGIGVGIAHALGKSKLIVFSAGVAGFVGAFADALMNGTLVSTFSVDHL